MPSDIFVEFTDIQAKLVSHSFEKLDVGLEKRKELAEELIANFDDVVKKLIPSLLYDHLKDNSFWHFPIYINEDMNNFQKYLLKKGVDAVGYGLCLCSHEQCFLPYQANLINSFNIKEKTIFLPIHDDFSKKNMQKIAKIVNNYYKEKE
jgi:dTDP-4-amino-4,6-dideoxygalactose transaminase